MFLGRFTRVHELDRRAAAWIAQRVAPLARALEHVGPALRRAREWPWFLAAAVVFLVLRTAPPRDVDVVAFSWLGVVLSAAGLLVALKQ